MVLWISYTVFSSYPKSIVRNRKGRIRRSRKAIGKVRDVREMKTRGIKMNWRNFWTAAPTILISKEFTKLFSVGLLVWCKLRHKRQKTCSAWIVRQAFNITQAGGGGFTLHWYLLGWRMSGGQNLRTVLLDKFELGTVFDCCTCRCCQTVFYFNFWQKLNKLLMHIIKNIES